ncbi:MAG: MltA domain-containing protein [Desulfobacterota bacterium]|nr:MltA domain-containing protein [Thermodesulfobacteriota bacterium]
MRMSCKKQTLIAFAVMALSFVTACHPPVIKEAEGPEQALIPERWFYPSFEDDMDLDSLQEALERNLQYLTKLSPEREFVYGPHRYTSRQVMESQAAFLELIKTASGVKDLNDRLRKEFLVYKAAGRDGQFLFTGYFEPIFEGRLRPDASFKYPIYRRPDDLIKVDLSLFSEEFKGKSIMARIDGKNVIPYYSRQQIAQGKALEGRGLELAWLKDPVDVAFLQVQGSGRLDLGDGKYTRVGYSEKNGLPYRPIGRYLMEQGLLTREEMSMQSIRRVLAERPEKVEEVLNFNPSYVFFRDLGQSPPVGNINVPITPGRTVALDSRLFPAGAIGWIKTQKPKVNDKGEIVRWESFSRFVMNQDTGGAIRGPGRADLFWGSGPYAELAAGHMRHEGALYILIKKPGK